MYIKLVNEYLKSCVYTGGGAFFSCFLMYEIIDKEQIAALINYLFYSRKYIAKLLLSLNIIVGMLIFS